MSSQKFGKARRVRRRREYDTVFKAGIRVQGRHFTLVLGSNTADTVRLGIVASRKLGNAVVRNRIKRLIREMFRRTDLASVPGVDVVVIPRSSIVEAEFPALETDFRGAFRRGVARLQGHASR